MLCDSGSALVGNSLRDSRRFRTFISCFSAILRDCEGSCLIDFIRLSSVFLSKVRTVFGKKSKILPSCSRIFFVAWAKSNPWALMGSRFLKCLTTHSFPPYTPSILAVLRSSIPEESTPKSPSIIEPSSTVIWRTSPGKILKDSGPTVSADLFVFKSTPTLPWPSTWTLLPSGTSMAVVLPSFLIVTKMPKL